MTQLEQARRGIVTPEMRRIAEDEGLPVDDLRLAIAAGTVVVLCNRFRDSAPLGVGSGLRTKVNANLGSSPERSDAEHELEKLRVALAAGADAVMDLSLGSSINEIRARILDACPVALGTVPLYQVGYELSRAGRPMSSMTIDDYLAAVRRHAEEGVDFITVHAGLTRRAWSLVKEGTRLLGVVSRGGSMLCRYMEDTGLENPLFEHYDRLLEVAYEYDLTLSLGDGLRPGAVADATDAAQIEELVVLGELGRRARSANVQVMIEGPGHVPLDQVEANVKLEKRLCDGAPFYILGPLVTDRAAGHDHIAGAIGGAVAAMAGADFLCYLTPAEHLSLPEAADVHAGVLASRIAAHAADLVKLGRRDRDDAMSRARAALDWDGMEKHALDPAAVRTRRAASGIGDKEYCTMCGEFCSARTMNECIPGRQ